MNYGLYLSASGILPNMYRQDVFANNLANAHTVGFKPDMPGVYQRDVEAVQDRFSGDLSHRLLDNLGGGVFAGPQRTDHSVGLIEMTGRATDVALETKGTFFVVNKIDPLTGQAQLHLTRDGRFASAGGFLVTAMGRLRVIGESDQPIEVGSGDLRIDPAGRVYSNDEQVGRLQVVSVPDAQELRKVGRNLFRVPETSEQARQVVEAPTLTVGAVEGSATAPIKAMMQLVSATKQVAGNANLIRYHDILMDRAVNVLGRVEG